MEHIDVKRMGLAFGITGTLLYIGCVFVMATVSKKAAVTFFNSLLHGVDVTHVLRGGIPLWQLCLGVVETFVLGWLIGAAIAAFYNLSGKELTAS